MNKTQASQRSRRQILRLIKEKKQISRAELAKLTGLTRPTVSSIVAEFVENEMILESGKGESCGGKRPIILELNKDACYAVGIDLGDDYLIRGALCDFCGNIVADRELEYVNEFENILGVLEQLITELVGGIEREKVRGVGIAVSGIVDAQSNEVVNSSTLDIEKRQLAKRLSQRSGFRVILENRPNAAALAETQFGAGKDFNNLVYITSGRGVGAGVVINGKIFRGSFGTAGEIGEIRIPLLENGSLSSFCLEDLTRASAIKQRAEKAKGCKLRFSEIVEAYYNDDQAINAIMDENATYMGYAAQIIADLLNPEAIILGGRAVELGDKYLKAFREHFESGLAKALVGGLTEVKFSQYGQIGVAVGGAAVVIELVMDLKV
ncbi:ROK family transcriptional regulator [Lentisphaerota bacterium ZTH]|nr:ROK family transcriptional regulator [Lentisphaerota bacterium]WET06391.1 ROK family transcriptional regulator [Lentisphaerota bacterium ZTH]